MAIYYVKNGGSNALSGLDDANAWETVAYVNTKMATFNAGDSILFKRGSTWSDATLTITQGGTSPSYITFGAYGTGAKPIIGNTGIVGITCSTNNISWIHIDNLEVYTVPGVGAFSAISVYGTGHTNWWLSDLLISQSDQNGILFQCDMDTILIDDCIVHTCDNSGIAFYNYPLDTYTITNTTIRDCISYSNLANDTYYLLYGTAGTNHLVDGCEAYWSAEQGFDSQSGTNVTFTNCYSHDNTQGSWILGAAINGATINRCRCSESTTGSYVFYLNSGASNVTIKNCIAYYAAPAADKNVFTVASSTGNSSNIYIYNNTVLITTNPAKLLVLTSAKTTSNLIVKDNIFIDLSATPSSTWVQYNNTSQDPNDVGSTWDYNWYYVPNVTEGTNARWYKAKVPATSYNYANWKSTWSQDSHSSTARTTDPSLVNATGVWSAATDFKISSTSPCINIGTELGVTTDYWGSLRPHGIAPDIGAHEYMGAGGTLTDEGETDMGNAYLKGTARTAFWLGLFKNTSGLGETTVLTDITEPSGGGYARIQLLDADWTESATKGIYVNLQKIFTATAAWGDVYGYFICSVETGTAGVFKAFEIFFDGPYTITDTWSVQVTPSMAIA